MTTPFSRDSVEAPQRPKLHHFDWRRRVIGGLIDNVRSIVRAARGFAQSLRFRVDAHRIGRREERAGGRGARSGGDVDRGRRVDVPARAGRQRERE